MNKLLNKETLTLLAGVLGVVAGLYYPTLSENVSFMGDIFILLLKMMIIPLVFTSIFLSIVNLPLGDVKDLGIKTIVYYFMTSSLACLTGLFIAVFVLTPSVQVESLQKIKVTDLGNISFNEFMTSFFSGNIFDSLSQGNIVQIVVFTIILSLASLKLDQSARTILTSFFDSIQKLMSIIINWICLLYTSPSPRD